MARSKNTSAAVMQQRHISRDEFDYFPTPPWGTRALCDFLNSVFYAREHALEGFSVLEPACGEGFMARPLAEYFGAVFSGDIQDFRSSFPGQDVVGDFLSDWGGAYPMSDWVVTNPPFKLAEQFILQALEKSREGVAILARIAFAEGIERYNSLFSKHPPAAIVQFVERLAMEQGSLRKKSSNRATCYAWFIWDKTRDAESENDTRFFWLPPGTLANFEQDSDYPKWAEEPAALPLFDESEADHA